MAQIIKLDSKYYVIQSLSGKDTISLNWKIKQLKGEYNKSGFIDIGRLGIPREIMEKKKKILLELKLID